MIMVMVRTRIGQKCVLGEGGFRGKFNEYFPQFQYGHWVEFTNSLLYSQGYSISFPTSQGLLLVNYEWESEILKPDGSSIPSDFDIKHDTEYKNHFMSI